MRKLGQMLGQAFRVENYRLEIRSLLGAVGGDGVRLTIIFDCSPPSKSSLILLLFSPQLSFLVHHCPL